MLSLRYVLALFPLLLPLNLGAQDSCRQRTVIVNVVDVHGIPVKGLSGADFKARVSGHPAAVLNTYFSEGPRRIVILLDVSGSMLGPPTLFGPPTKSDSNKWKIAREAVRDVLSSAAPRSQISFMTFADKVEDRLNPSPGNDDVLKWLNSRIEDTPRLPKGQTALLDAISQALKQLEPAQAGDAIYVITDGFDNKSRDSASRVSQALRASGVRLFTFLLSDTEFVEQGFGPEGLWDLTTESGGFFVGFQPASHTVAGSPIPLQRYAYDERVMQSLKAESQVMSAQISGFYLLTLQLPSRLSKRSELQLEAVDDRGHKKKDLTVTYPHRLFSCAEAVRH